ncbi:MAG: hypothetical protein JXR10_09350 [Cyclobacteriaceae bacterium]
MNQYKEERVFVEDFKAKIANKENLSQEDILKLIHSYEDLVEIAAVSMKMIDRLMINYDLLRNRQAK